MLKKSGNSHFSSHRKSTLLGIHNLRPLIIVGAFVASILALTVLVTKLEVLVFIALVVVVFMLVALFYWPEPGTILVISTIYTNLAVVAYKLHGMPQMLAASISLLLCVPLAVYWFVRKEKFVIDYSWMLMWSFLAALLASLMVSKDISIGMNWIVTYLLEGLALYIIVINVVRKYSTLRSVVWAVLFSGALLGALTLIQELTHDYNNNFMGLAQRNTSRWDGGEDSFDDDGGLFREREKVKLANRSSGPIGDPNRYAQIMIVLLPLGMFRFFDEKTRKGKASALVLTLFILAGMLLTYSRGAFITISILMLFIIFLRYIRFSRVAIAIAAILLVISVTSPGYFIRMSSIFNVQALFTNDASVKADGATRGRVTEMLAAFNCFLDHPLVGVGPGQYAKFYSIEYMADPSIAFRDILTTRRAHTLYFELLAETGILGFATFMSAVVLILVRLWRLRQYFTGRNRELANMCTAFWLSILSYLFTAVFLHFSYQRYYWLLLAISGAAAHIMEGLRTEETPEPEMEISEETITRFEGAL